MSLSKLVELHELAKAQGKTYQKRRFLYEELEGHQGRHFQGIIGPRGVGKTILLRQYALAHDQAFYLSADSLERGDDLWEIIKKLQTHYGVKTLLLDEIHFLPNATGVLKQLYDFLDLPVIFTSSVALAVQSSAHDLSRRVLLKPLLAFSYREYLAFQKDVVLPKLGLLDILEATWSPDHLRQGVYFDAYLQGGLLPFGLDEPEPLVLLQAIQDKVIYKDVPSVLRLAVEEIDILKRLIRFVGLSEVDGINYSSLSQNLGITKYKAEQYVRCLEQAFILVQVFPKGTNVLREPKVLLTPPYRLLYRDFQEAIGGLREDYFVHAAKQAHIEVHYLKSTRGKKTPDYLVELGQEKLAIEIGGKGKGREQFKGVTVDRKIIFAHQDVPENKRYPLFLLGYMA
ncbi:MAG: AAA family ATPase [Phycisphaerae bacterium]|nr:AAA family ATPase [Phycisphaerae bacterium]